LDAVAVSAMVIELHEQLIAWKREWDSQEGAFMVWEDGLVASERTLGRARMECDDECDRAEAIR
jgi:hypothetical protein